MASHAAPRAALLLALLALLAPRAAAARALLDAPPAAPAADALSQATPAAATDPTALAGAVPASSMRLDLFFGLFGPTFVKGDPKTETVAPGGKAQADAVCKSKKIAACFCESSDLIVASWFIGSSGATGGLFSPKPKPDTCSCVFKNVGDKPQGSTNVASAMCK